MPPGATYHKPTAAHRRPVVQQIIAEACALAGAEPHNVCGRNRRSTYPARAARHLAVIKLYGTPMQNGTTYGLSETGRALGIDHATVWYYLRKRPAQ